MYKSPIDMVVGETQMIMDNEVFKAVKKVGIVVNKEELIAALKYDRGQYDKGYQDGYKAKEYDRYSDCERCKFVGVPQRCEGCCRNYADGYVAVEDDNTDCQWK